MYMFYVCLGFILKYIILCTCLYLLRFVLGYCNFPIFVCSFFSQCTKNERRIRRRMEHGLKIEDKLFILSCFRT